MVPTLLNYLFVTIIGWLLIMATSTPAPPPSPPCKKNCGDLTIPYPFGMGSPKCFLNKWFEISCTNSKALLKNNNQLQLLKFSLSDGDSGENNGAVGQWAQLRSPITFFDCANKTTKFPANLTGTPFFYTSSNEFLAVTCGARAKLETTTGNRFYGCASSESNSSTTLSGVDFVNCDSIKCCTTTSFTSSIGVSVEISMDNSTLTTSGGSQCKYAFLMDLNSLNETFSDDREYVPVQISWRLNSTLREIYKSDEVMPNSSTAFYCKNSSVTNLTYSCHCKSGYQGNPYVVDGCQDINECESKTRKFCQNQKGTYCFNTIGSYECKHKTYKPKFFFLGFAAAVGALGQIFGTWRSYKLIKKIKEINLRNTFFKQNGGPLLEQFTIEANNLETQDNNIDEANSSLDIQDNNVDIQDNNVDDQANKIDKVKLFSLEELEKITDHFSRGRIVGQGDQGSVYKGMLEDGTIVAVKKFKLVDEAKLDEFTNEVAILWQINHINVVKLLGCCLETDVPFLVYEFVPNGTLSDHIHEKMEFTLTWNMRLRIAIDVATALSYLHSATPSPINHWDVKSTSILLDEKFRAKLANIRISKSLEQSYSTTPAFDTFGYLDPEYFESNQFTDKSDVYSFGVVLVELLTGPKAISARRSEEERSLATYFKTTMKERNGLFDILDGQVRRNAPKEEILNVADLALKCLHVSGRARPTMKQVAMDLKKIKVNDKDFKGAEHNNNEVLKYVSLENVDNSLNDSTSLVGSFFDCTACTS
ncbi:wall-associated receptor kinase-like 1 [Humulus lupulus]|uniref:wall-associated receptor kinase-like 1 n=1 Tax=Humulus lupulus TaxID=3486 RepID=UPI002B4156BA|nr:wall-associated receptor kinase-like 1 [Humulus lupulus]XP_062102808.1 wall-associated receptor kinase-like 1 [Humulus lupulus]